MEALYSTDPVRNALVPQLVELLEATNADRCALVWSLNDGSGGAFPHIVIDAAQDESHVTFGAGVAARGVATASNGTVGTGRARPSKNVAYMIAAKNDRRWCLVLSGARMLNLGRDVARIFQESRYLAISVLIDIEDESLWDQRETTGTPLEQAEEAEASGDYEVALGLYEVARSACLAMGLAESGIRAMWYQGRSLRKLGRLEGALGFYELAETAARKLTDQSLAAAIMTGRGHVHRLRGNIPLARETYKAALNVSPPSALAIPLAYHGLMLCDKDVGAFASAVRYGWEAFLTYPENEDDQDRYSTLVVLGNILVECGDLHAAEDAYAIVVRLSQTVDIRVSAKLGLAQVAARKGDLERYEGLAGALVEIGEGEVQAKIMVQALLERARNEWILGRVDRAHEAVDEAVGLAEAHKLGRLIIEADEVRAMLENPKPTPRRPAVKGTSRVRGKLEAFRATLTA